MAAGDESTHPPVEAHGSAPALPPGKPGGLAALGPHSDARAVYLRFVEVVEHDGRYPLEAYAFLQEGLEFTVRRIHGESASQPLVKTGRPDPRHVDGEQLCRGMRDLALARWGRLAKTVLNSWGVHGTRDFGEMVFVLVANEFLHQTDEDRLDHFENVFSFCDFERLYEVPRQPLHCSDFEYSSESSTHAAGIGGSLA